VEGSAALRITVSENGPYLVEGRVAIVDAEGRAVEPRNPESFALCRCGGSQNKPFCDGTHRKNGFVGTEVADRGPIAARRIVYRGAGVTVFDDRSICSHVGYCTDRLPAVFRSKRDPWIEPDAASVDEVVAAVRRCPSGALAYAVGHADVPVEEPEDVIVMPSRDGPYFVRGRLELVSPDGTGYERRPHYTLCRCGGSKNKPFCDGTHWYKGFRAP
jgi:CDGSH-type Zn-finger protein/ferredoxin